MNDASAFVVNRDFQIARLNCLKSWKKNGNDINAFVIFHVFLRESFYIWQ